MLYPDRVKRSVSVCLLWGVAAMAIMGATFGHGVDDEVLFPDDNLEAAVRVAINRPTGDIRDSDLVGVGFTTLDGADAGIADLSGIENCLDLEILILAGNQISDLTPLAALTNLAELNINNNTASSLTPLADLPNLSILRAKNNGITSLPDMGSMTGLTELTLGGNAISDVSPIAALPSLIAAGLSSNSVTGVSPGDLPDTLETLYLAANMLSDISGVAGAAGLVTLDISQNMVSDLSALEGLSDLASLALQDNSLTAIGPLLMNDGLGSGDLVDLSENPLGMQALCLDIPALQAWGVAVTFSGACSSTNEGEGEGEGALHTADQNGDGAFNLPELLRVVQFYNASGLSCDATSEDGFAPGSGDTACVPHGSDYMPQDWEIALSELLRAVQFFNAGAYRPCEGGEDGFCAGVPAKPPNVVFVILDTVRGDRMWGTRNGLPVAPFMRTFADAGVNFLEAVAPATWTRPTCASFFSGLYPNLLSGPSDGGRDDRYFVDDELVSLGEWFAGHGYDCWGIQTNGHASAYYGFDQGFPDGRYVQSQGLPGHMVTDLALESMPQWQEPFFEFIQYFDAHGPHAPPVEYDTIFGPQPEITVSDEMNISVEFAWPYIMKTTTAWLNGVQAEEPLLTPAGQEALQYRYDAEIRYLDDELERLTSAIEEVYPNTLFIITSDHGQALEERERLIGHGHTLYQEQARIPLVVKGPGVTPAVIETPVEALGVLPTMANILGLPPHPQWQAQDCFVQAANPGPVYCHTFAVLDGLHVYGEAVIHEGMKLFEHNLLDGYRLYDLVNDPLESADLVSGRPDDVAILSGLLQAHKARVAPLD